MNKTQRIIIIVGIALIVGMILFPPWVGSVHRYREGRSKYPAGYGLLFYPPSDAESVDSSRLLLQILGVAILAGGLFVITKDSTK